MSQICLFFSAASAATLVLPTHIFPWVMVTAWFPLLRYCFLPVCFPHCSQSGLSKVESGDSGNNSKYLNRADLYWSCIRLPPSSRALPAVLEPYSTLFCSPMRVLLCNLWTSTHDVTGDSSSSSASSSCLNLLLFLELKFSCLCSFVWIP